MRSKYIIVVLLQPESWGYTPKLKKSGWQSVEKKKERDEGWRQIEKMEVKKEDKNVGEES